MKRCDKNILSTLEVVNQMIRLAERGDADREDIGCGILYGVLLDSAYKIKRIAEEERQAHIEKGWWNTRKEKGEL